MNELLGNALKQGVNSVNYPPAKRREIGETFSGMYWYCPVQYIIILYKSQIILVY